MTEEKPMNRQAIHERWDREIESAMKSLKKWHTQGDKIVKRFLDERGRTSSTSRLNLFSANVQTLRAMLYGNAPEVQVDRRFADADDDTARVASEMLERLLNTDIEADDGTDRDALFEALSDRLLPGAGVARVRYEADFEEVDMTEQLLAQGMMVEEQVIEERKTWEDCVVDYVYWKDFLWSPARVWSEVRWVAFKVYLTKEQVEERFGEEFVKVVTFQGAKRGDETNPLEVADPSKRAEVWEVWCKDDRMVYWWNKGAGLILDAKEDPLELDGFFPCPKPLFANLTTSNVLPRPDFILAQDQYMEIDNLTTRINMLQKAVKAVGVYDQSAEGVKRMLSEGVENDLIPVDNWAAFAEKGGIQGTVVWMPLGDVVGAMDKLREYRKELIELLYQVTGMSDILRGAQTMGQMTATEAAMKARFGSVRVQEMQNEFVAFATTLQRMKAEIITRHFDDETIVQRSNVEHTPDAQFVMPALQLLRDRFMDYRISIDSQQVSMTDFAALKAERLEYIQGLATFLQTAAPMAQQVPGSMPFLLELLKVGMAGFRGARQMETIMDQAIEAAKQMAEQPQGEQQPDPGLQKEQLKLQQVQAKNQAKMQEIQAKAAADVQKVMTEAQARMQELQAEVQADGQREAQQAAYNVEEERQKAAIRAREKSVTSLFGQ